MNTKAWLRNGMAAMTLTGALMGCTGTDGEDAGPVEHAGPKTAGSALVAQRNLGGDWNQSTRVETGSEYLSLGASQVSTLKKTAALAKRSGWEIGGDLGIDFSDTAKGEVTLYVEKNFLGYHERDTVVAKWDDKARDSVKDNENIISAKVVKTHDLTGKVETAVLTDADGDGILNAKASGESKAKIEFRSEEKGIVESAVLVVGAGADGDFDQEGDNTVYQAVWVRKKGGEVLAEATFKDGEKDGIVVDNSKDCLVDVSMWEKDPAHKPFTAKVEVTARIKVLADKKGDEPVSLSFTETLKTGRVNKVRFVNRITGQEILAKGDTTTVILTSEKRTSRDTLENLKVEFVMSLGQDLKAESDDSLYAVNVVCQKRVGAEKKVELHLVSDKPVVHGKEMESGRFDLYIEYRDGKTATLEGTFGVTGYKAAFKDAAGATHQVQYDRNGAAVEGEVKGEGEVKAGA